MGTISEEINKSKKRSKISTYFSLIAGIISLLIGVFYFVNNKNTQSERVDEIINLIEQKSQENKIIFNENNEIRDVINQLDSSIDHSTYRNISSDSLRKQYEILQRRIDSLNQQIRKMNDRDVRVLEEIKRKN